MGGMKRAEIECLCFGGAAALAETEDERGDHVLLCGGGVVCGGVGLENGMVCLTADATGGLKIVAQAEDTIDEGEVFVTRGCGGVKELIPDLKRCGEDEVALDGGVVRDEGCLFETGGEDDVEDGAGFIGGGGVKGVEHGVETMAGAGEMVCVEEGEEILDEVGGAGTGKDGGVV